MVSCLNCGKQVKSWSTNRVRKYCDRKCWKQHWNGENTHMFGRKLSTEVKEKVSAALRGKTYSSKGKKLSPETIEKRRSSLPRGKDHHAWKGGKGSYHHKVRCTPEWREWRTAVYERDGYKCLDCGSNENLEPHHIIPVRDEQNRHLLFSITNGVSLCRECHMRTFRKEPELIMTYSSLIPIS